MKKNDINRRMESLIEALKMTKHHFASRIKVASPLVYNFTSGRNAPSFEVLSKITREFPEVNLRWLLIGEGSILGQAIPEEDKEEGLDEIGLLKAQMVAIQNRVSEIEKLLKLQ